MDQNPEIIDSSAGTALAGPALIPHFVQEQYVQGNYNGQFAAVSLFVDISGFSAVTHDLAAHGSEAAETMAEIMLKLFTPLVEQVYGHDGYITTFAGDAFTALFPIAPDEPHLAYQHALAAAIGIQQHMGANPVQDTVYGRFTFAAKLGLGDGNVFWGILNPPPQDKSETDLTGQWNKVAAAYYFSGPAIEAAAAAEHQAQSGNLILSPAASERLAGEVKTLPAGDQGYRRWLAAVGKLVDIRPLTISEPPDQSAFIPPAILERKSRGEFRQIISVFINLMGIDSSDQLDLFMQSVFELQQRFGGYVNRVDFGDKGCNLLMFWGMPVSTENDLERALNFILELPAVTPGTFRAGITFRSMYAGLAGSDRRAEFTCYGDGVNLAARLMTQSPWGEIWLDENVYRRAGRRYATEPRGEFEFKGFSEKMPVFSLLERGQVTLNLEQFYQDPMVGRQKEIEDLARFVEPLFTPQDPQRFAGAMLIQGEAGIGKSRLATEFVLSLEKGRHRLADPAYNPQIFICQTDQTASQTLNPFRSWLLEYFQQSATQSEARNKRSFSRKLDELITSIPDAALASDLNRLRSCLGELVNLSWDNSLYAQLDARARYENTMIVLKDLLLAECLRRPVVLYLEDVHWLDEDSRQFLTRLVRNIDGYPLAILATSRLESSGQPLGNLTCRSITLLPFARDELVAMAEHRLSGALDPKLVQLLYERSEGIPFIAEQTLHFLSEHNGLVQKNGTWCLARSSKSLLPTDVSAIFNAQLDALPAEVKDVVLCAAILGREFYQEILAYIFIHLLQQSQDITPQIAAAQQESILLPTGQSRYLFKHTMLRDAAYEMQLRARRRQLHQFAAEAYLAIYKADPQDQYGKISYHYETAYIEGLKELQPFAFDYLMRAGQQAAGKFENTAAVDYYSRALALLPEEDLAVRFDVLLAREEIYHLRGERSAQLQDLEALQGLAAQLKVPQNQATVAVRRARYATATANYDDAIRFTQEAARFAQTAQNASTEAWAGQLCGNALVRQGKYEEARQQYLQAYELANAVDDLARQGDALTGLGNVNWFMGNLKTAHQYYLQAVDLYQTAGRQREIGVAYGNLAIVLHLLDQHCPSQEYFQRSLTIARQIGDRAGESNVLGNLGRAVDGLGQYALAKEYYLQSLNISREIGVRQMECVALLNLGNTAWRQGYFQEAVPLLDQALDLARQTKNRASESQSLNLLGEVFSQLQDMEAAQSYFEQALALRKELKNEQGIIENETALARLCLAQNQLQQALIWVEQVLPAIEKDLGLDKPNTPLQAYLSCYQVLRSAEDARAAPILEAAYKHLQDKAAAISDEDLRTSFLEQIPEHRTITQLYLKDLHPEAALPPAIASTVESPAPAAAPVTQSVETPPAAQPPLEKTSTPPAPAADPGPAAQPAAAEAPAQPSGEAVLPVTEQPAVLPPAAPQTFSIQLPAPLEPSHPKKDKKKKKKKRKAAAQTVINIRIVIYPGNPPQVKVETE